MGSFFEREESMTPRLAPGMEPFQQFFQALTQQLQGGTGVFQGPGGPFAAPLGAGERSAIEGLSQFDIPGLVQQSLDVFGNVASPEFVGQIADSLRPVLVDRPFEQGSAQLREQAALTGNQVGSGVLQDSFDLLMQLEQNLGAAAPGLAAQLGQLQLGGAQAGLGGAAQILGALGLPRQVQDLDIQRQLQESQFARGLPIGLTGSLGGLGGLLYNQPRTGPSKFESLLQMAAPVAAARAGRGSS